MIKSFFIFIIFISLIYTSCVKDPEITNESELITTVNYKLVPVSGSSTVTFTFKDLDGDGGNAAQITGGTLKANTVYTGTVELLNEQSNPAKNITTEVETENQDHQFFYTLNGGLAVNVRYNDADANGNPVGISTLLQTSTASSGKLKIVLRHKPNKLATGVKEGTITNAGGETDLEVEFPVNVN